MTELGAIKSSLGLFHVYHISIDSLSPSVVREEGEEMAAFGWRPPGGNWDLLSCKSRNTADVGWYISPSLSPSKGPIGNVQMTTRMGNGERTDVVGEPRDG